MDKDKMIKSFEQMIKSLEQIIDDLKGEDKPTLRYELRYWDDERPSNPNLLSDSFDDMRDALYVRVKAFYKAELKDTKIGKIVISYNEETRNG